MDRRSSQLAPPRAAVPTGVIAALVVAASCAPGAAGQTPEGDAGSPPAPSTEMSPDGLVPSAPGVPLSPADALVERLQQPLPVGEPVGGVTPRQDRGAFVAKILEPTRVMDAPGGERLVWTAKTKSLHTGNATRLMVVKARFDAAGVPWLGVQLPIRPNETLGWVQADQVRIEFTDVFVRVRLTARTVTVYRAGRRISQTRAVIGAGKTPTPRGLFSVYEIASQGNPRSYLGSWALHLTAFSQVLKNYGGGPGRAAIHGRGPQSIADAKLGEAASHGCVRTPNAFVEWLRTRATPGTPVQISER